MTGSASAHDLFASQAPCGGFFYCGHCDHVVELPPEAEVNEYHKCPRCKKHTVTWRFRSPDRGVRIVNPVPRDSQVAADWFAKMREVIA